MGPQHGRKLEWLPSGSSEAPLFRAMAHGRPLPERTSLRSASPPIYDQGELGSCTAEASTAVFEIADLGDGVDDLGMASSLAVYYLMRLAMGTEDEDSGGSIAGAFKAILAWGLPPEALWPYVVANFRLAPPKAVLEAAKKRRPTAKMAVRVAHDLGQMKAMLAAGHAVAGGFPVSASFMSDRVARTGVMPMPKRGEKELGGHAVAFIGYDDAKGALEVRNSWSVAWGDKGHFWMPYAFYRQCSDFHAAVDSPDGRA